MNDKNESLRKFFKTVYIWEIIIWISTSTVIPLLIYVFKLVSLVLVTLSIAAGTSYFIHNIYYLKYKKAELKE